MKKIKSLFILFYLLTLATYAQAQFSMIKDRASIDYTFKLHGQTRKMNISFEIKADSIMANWSMNSSKGSYLIQSDGFRKGNQLSFKQPEPMQTIKLRPNETFCLISLAAFNDLLEKHYFIYNNTTYRLNEDGAKTLSIEGKKVDVLHVVAEIDETEMWILNNPGFPLICQLTKNPLGINFSIDSISIKPNTLSATS